MFVRPPVDNVLFDAANKTVYFVDKRGVYRSEVLFQRQDQADSLANLVEFGDFDDR